MAQVPSCGCSGSSGSPLFVASDFLDPLGYEQLIVTTVVSLNPPAGAELAIIQNATTGNAAGARWRDDGVAPTPTLGMVFPPGTQFEYIGDLSAFQVVNIGGPAEEINVSYYKYTDG